MKLSSVNLSTFQLTVRSRTLRSNPVSLFQPSICKPPVLRPLVFQQWSLVPPVFSLPTPSSDTSWNSHLSILTPGPNLPCTNFLLVSKPQAAKFLPPLRLFKSLLRLLFNHALLFQMPLPAEPERETPKLHFSHTVHIGNKLYFPCVP